MALPDWQMSILSNASSAALRERVRDEADFSGAFRRFTLRGSSAILRVPVSRFSDCANFRRRTSGPTERTEEQRAIVD